MFLTAIMNVIPVPPFLYLTGQVWDGAVLGRLVRAVRLVQGACYVLGALWGLIKV